MNNKQGFTLIELSIAIVIIGLLVGGVLVGQDLIKAAELRAQVADIDKINASVNTFRLKYNCLPGDCKNATLFFGGTSQPEQVTNGDGNKRIRAYWNAGAWNDVPHADVGWVSLTSWPVEFGSVFDHLAAAGLVSLSQYDETPASSVTVQKPGVTFPKLTFSSKGQGPLFSPTWNNQQGGLVIGYEPGLGYVPEGHKFRLGACPGAPQIFQCGINPWEARAIDEKVDDGKPFSGNTVVVNNSYTFRMGGNFNHYDYAYCYAGNPDASGVTTNRYRNENEIASWGGSPVNRYCALSIKASF